MSKFLSLPLWWRAKSDADYVERVRKQVRMGKKAAVFAVFMALLCGVAAIWVGQAILSLFQEGRQFPALEVALGMALGLLAGGVSGFFLSIAVVQISLAARFVYGFRTEKLLLKYYDLAASSEREK